MNSHILRPGTTGPTGDQRRMLESLHLNPDDFNNKLASEITAIIGAEFRKRKDYGQVMVARRQNEREQRILQLGLREGSKVVRRTYTRNRQSGKHEKDEMVDVVMGITPDWKVCFAGIKNPIHPSQIMRVLP